MNQKNRYLIPNILKDRKFEGTEHFDRLNKKKTPDKTEPGNPDFTVLLRGVTIENSTSLF